MWKKYIRKKGEPLKQVAIINGFIKCRMLVIIHPDNEIEFVDFKGDKLIDKYYTIETSRDIDEKEYYEVISR